MALTTFKGAIFDLDGVITETAAVHSKAWKSAFDAYLKKRAILENGDFEPFSIEDDYLSFVDGKPRYEGVQSFLESRKITLPYGSPDDQPDQETICGIGNRKNAEFIKLLKSQGAKAFKGSVDFIKNLKKQKIKIGVASSSKNCRLILEKVGLLKDFATRIDGSNAKELGLKGKPEPDYFLRAAEELGLTPGECIMVEDSISGVMAGKKGNFGLVLGVCRNVKAHELIENGADIVVRDLAEITPDEVHEWFKTGIEKDGWNLTYNSYLPDEEKLREALTTVGNGYIGTRGCFETCKDSEYHYPGTYIAGLYNKPSSIVHGRKIYNNDFVNCPNWTLMEIKFGRGDFFDPTEMEIVSYLHQLRMQEGVVYRKLTFREPQSGKVTTIESERFASMDNPHIMGLNFRIKAHNYTEPITVRAAIDGHIINNNVPRYRNLSTRHLIAEKEGLNGDDIYLNTKTIGSQITIFLSSRTQTYKNNSKFKATKTVSGVKGFIGEEIVLPGKKNVEYRIEKIVSIYTSKDRDVRDPELEARKELVDVPSFDLLLKASKKAWQGLWDMADIRVDGDRFVQKATRLHIYHLLVSASPHNSRIDAGMTARGLTGEAYRGHIFWDELYILPFFNLHFPEISKALLLYRYRRLDAARENARLHGFDGAMYPWQTADDGSEETQIIHYNPLSGKWDPDMSSRQRHVNLAISYNVWQYYYCTGDIEFIHQYGAEMMFEIARFWASIARFDKKDHRYHIEGVMGPDEFHEKHGKDSDGGLKDNAYTNIMVAWLLHKTIETLEHLPARIKRSVVDRISLKDSELKKWKDIVKRLKVVITKDGIISQFDGYMKLKDVDWDYYRKNYGNIHRMDRILKAEGDSPDKYKVAKQADTLMLYYNMSPGQLSNILNIMGYQTDDPEKMMKKNYDYYIQRTSHGSTLSYVVHSAILKYNKGNSEQMWQRFLHAMKSDIEDTQGGTTPEGIHCGVMGGTLDIFVSAFAGINLFKDYISLSPQLPSHFKSLEFKILREGVRYDFIIQHGSIKVKAHNNKGKTAIEVGNRKHYLNKRSLTIKYD